MARSRTTFTLALAAALAVPLAARAAVPVGLYPVQSEGLTEGERSEIQAVVESALGEADRRGVLEPRSPLLVPASCKQPITVGCVATLAKGGVVLYAKAKRRGAQILVTVLFVDAVGRKTKATSFPIDLFVQNLRPAHDAIASLEAALASGALEDSSPPPPPATPAPRAADAERPKVAEAPPAGPEAARPASEPPKEAPKEPVAAAPARERPGEEASVPLDLSPLPKAAPPVAPKTPPPPASGVDWRVGAGRWCTGGGVALLVAGSVVGLTGKRLSDALTDRYERGALRAGDAALYDRVDRYARIANVLFAAGGVATAAGIGFFAVAPTDGGATVAVAGSF